MTLADRLRLALDQRGMTPYRLAQKANVSLGYVGRILDGTRGKRVGADVISKLAAALAVSPAWLSSGTGPMETVLEVADRYPNRSIAAGIARDGGVGEAAVASVLADELDADEDHPVLWWLDRMRLRETMLRTQDLPGAAVRQSDVPAPRGPRRKR